VFPEVSVIHAAWVEAVHAHSRATATFIVPLPPAGSKEDEELVTDAWHRVLVGEVAVAMLVLAELPQAAIKSGRTTTRAPCRPDRTRCTSRRDARFSPSLTSTVQRSRIVTRPITRVAESRNSGSVPSSRIWRPLRVRDSGFADWQILGITIED
jgi:hypothetical protein